MKRHFGIGLGSALLLIGVYLSLITLLQDLPHALEQMARLWYWLLALAGGFGIQVGLFSFIRQRIREQRAEATGSVAASGSVSTGAMVACCAHHLSDVLPLLGLSGLAIFLVRYQLFFIIIGVLTNIIGIIIMLETIQRHNLCPWVSRWPWKMGWVKRGAVVAAVLVSLVSFFLTA